MKTVDTDGVVGVAVQHLHRIAGQYELSGDLTTGVALRALSDELAEREYCRGRHFHPMTHFGQYTPYCMNCGAKSEVELNPAGDE